MPPCLAYQLLILGQLSVCVVKRTHWVHVQITCSHHLLLSALLPLNLSLVFKCGQMPLWRQCRVTGFSVTKHIRRVATLHPNSGFSFTPNPGIHRISRAVGPGVQLLLFACLMLNHRPLCFWEIVCLHPLPAAVTSSQSVTAAHPWLSLTLLQPPAWDISPDPGLPCLPMPLCRLLWL